MLVVISDLHMWDGTIGIPASPHGFSLFANRLRELVFQASWRTGGEYIPVPHVDVLLLGDIFDPLQSSRWQETRIGDPDYIRPWHDHQHPNYAPKLQEITRGIIQANSHQAEILKKLAQGEVIHIPPATKRHKPDFYTRQRFIPTVNIHYMVGNHDWYYHVSCPAFDPIRVELAEAFGLQNGGHPYPHEVEQSEEIQDLLDQYRVVARHGDIFDKFAYNSERGRASSSLSDIYCSEVLYRYPFELDRQIGDDLPAAMRTAIRHLTNIRPQIAAPLWLRGRIHELCNHPGLEEKVKTIWDEIITEFLELSSVKDITRSLPSKEMRVLRFIMGLSRQTSLQTMADVSGWLTRNMWDGDISIARHARRERAIQDKSARFVIYGHTHHHEVVPLGDIRQDAAEAEQVYINTGTWGTFYDMYTKKQKNDASHLLTCVAFYKDGQRNGRKFEPWWANFT